MKNFKSHDQARQLVTKYIKQIEELSNLVTDANRFLAQPEPPKQDSIREQIKKLELNIAGLTQRLEALEQRTQPSEKGVWVTRESLKYAFDATQEFIIRNDRFEELVEHLGLEE